MLDGAVVQGGVIGDEIVVQAVGLVEAVAVAAEVKAVGEDVGAGIIREGRAVGGQNAVKIDGGVRGGIGQGD